ncbi:DUF1524 domain-containing protein [Streptomyces sp. DSM 41524]|uniref:DUF1524 domain-containing protein n=1 Tax=Streptomyces asiaticus subsp. ignotus TaxID=3098222 RepID=A0ABU7Q3P9_9ACTN|nr:DUF1524 domain-containing protein [Streptomyces sp. DSM 41524]
MVPLAEAWHSSASIWSAQEHQGYANDLGDTRSLAAVTARENRSKADQDPTEWVPSVPGARCRYIEEWTVVKSRWRLSSDPNEVTALVAFAAGCQDTPDHLPHLTTETNTLLAIAQRYHPPPT